MPSDRPSAETWRRALDGDRDAFNDALAPYTDTLRRAAERQLDVERDLVTGDPTGPPSVDMTPEELVGETMVRAWDRRERFDGDRMGIRAWLLGLQTRSLAQVARREARYADRKAVSLDAELPVNPTQDAVEEDFYEFRQPFDVDTYEEVIPGSEPADVTMLDGDLTDDQRDALADARFDTDAAHAVVLHDEFEVSLSEVAQILNASLKDAAAEMNLAREGMLARMGSVDDDHDDDPAVDSYTGDPLPDA